ncbi:MAG: ADP-ribosylation factor-like protein [Promethearchaeota archaeon]
MSETKKLLVLGLDNAGKTTIVNLILDKVINPISIQPTKGVERHSISFLDQKIVIHDLGGQKKYRIHYLENPHVLKDTNVLIYVIDLQDRERYDLSLEYFEASLEFLNELQSKPVIFLIFHKLDGNYLEDYKDINTGVRVENARLKEKFMDVAKDLDFEVNEIFETSITDEWRCFEVFLKIWNIIIPLTKTLNEFLKTLVNNNKEVMMSLLMDIQGNVVAKAFNYNEGYDSEKLSDIAARSISILLDWQKTINHQNMKEKQDFAILEIEDQSIMLQRLETKKGNYYLVLYVIGGDYKEIQTRFASISFTLENLLQ